MRRGCIVLLLALAGCGRTDAGDAGAQTCEGAALEYHGVCFRAHDLGNIGFKQAEVFPLELDGAAGHELVSIGYDGLEVYRFDGDEFALSTKTSLPAGSLGLADHAVAAEFDGAPGRDLAVVDSGDWVGLYHVEDGAPTLVGETTFGPPTSQGLDWPVAVGPDDNGKWRVVAHFDSANVFFLADPLALWEVQGTSFVQIERFDLETAACVIDDRCVAADLDGDGRTDAICALRDECSESQAGQKEIVHVVVLAQADGNVTIAEYPTNGIGSIGAVIDLDGDDSPDLVGERWYRLGDGLGGLGPLMQFEMPTPPVLDWSIVSAGDLDGDGDVELVFGDQLHALVFDDVVGAPEDYEMLQVNAGGPRFGAGFDASSDVNADQIVDLPMYGWTFLVSELRG